MMHFPPTKFEAILDLVGNDKEFSVTPRRIYMERR